jgi:LytS/YehU family sensor histidine kinase
MLYDSNTDKISLSSEVEFIKDYVSLQKLRIKNPDIIELNLEGNFDNIMLPPMLLIPFIENAFKYCNKFDGEKAIVISISVKNNELFFTSSNCYDPENKTGNTRTGGIGLEVVEKRLDLLYPNKHEFAINKVDCQFIVSLKIQLDGH